jgi:hypothetical protein
MLKRFASFAVVAALLCTLGGTSAFANTSTETDSKAGGTASRPDSNTGAGKVVNERLRADMLKLVADAKAGKIVPPMRAQIQPRQSNNLTKGQKIAIGVGIAATIVVVIFLITSPRLNQ